MVLSAATGKVLKGILLVGLTLSTVADSLIFAPQVVFEHFNTNKDYLFLAARLGLPEANWLAYRQTNNIEYLQLAARNNHPAAVYAWYRYLVSKGEKTQLIWLEQAVSLDVDAAYLERLKLYVEAQQWTEAERFLLLHKSAFDRQEASATAQYLMLKESIELALNSALTIKASVQAVVGNKQVSASGWQHEFMPAEAGCRFAVRVLVAAPAMVRKAKSLFTQFNQSEMGKFGFCFLPIEIEPRLLSLCDFNPAHRIDCDLAKLALLLRLNEKTQAAAYSHILLMLDKGEANTRGGLMFVDDSDDLAVLSHEVAHWLGMVDEYRIGDEQQGQLCSVGRPSWIGHNVFVANKRLPKNKAEDLAQQRLFPTNTCAGTEFQAYKRFEEASFMEFLDLPLSDAYLALMASEQRTNNWIPAAMNLALTFKLEDTDVLSQEVLVQAQTEYVYWLTQAARWRFPPAMRLLAQTKIVNGKYNEARQLLELAADARDANAQLLLGHAYLEGRWLPRDLDESAFWYQQAAQQDDAFGLFFYGKCLEMGWGCPRSMAQAMEHYQKAADLGNHLAKRRLGQD